MRKSLKKGLVLLVAITMFAANSAIISNAAYYFDNANSYSGYAMGDQWYSLKGTQRQYTGRKYFGVTLTSLTSMDGSTNYTYMKARIRNVGNVIMSPEQTISRSPSTIYRFDLMVTTNDGPILCAKGNNPNLDARCSGTFYAN